MIDVQPVDRDQFKRHQQRRCRGSDGPAVSNTRVEMPDQRGTKTDMADEPEDPDAAADRLEAALERIAHLASMQPAPEPTQAASPDSELSIQEIAERLDQLIGRLRTALGKPE
jgi:hypothetical protein